MRGFINYCKPTHAFRKETQRLWHFPKGAIFTRTTSQLRHFHHCNVIFLFSLLLLGKKRRCRAERPRVWGEINNNCIPTIHHDRWWSMFSLIKSGRSSCASLIRTVLYSMMMMVCVLESAYHLCSLI